MLANRYNLWLVGLHKLRIVHNDSHQRSHTIRNVFTWWRAGKLNRLRHKCYRFNWNCRIFIFQTIEDFILLIGTIVAFIAFVLWCCFPIHPKVSRTVKTVYKIKMNAFPINSHLTIYKIVMLHRRDLVISFHANRCMSWNHRHTKSTPRIITTGDMMVPNMARMPTKWIQLIIAAAQTIRILCNEIHIDLPAKCL